jgi:two-component system LytT family response regulator
MSTIDPPITALIADDEPLVRWGLRRQLEEEPDIQILAECGDGPTAVRLIQGLGPELVFLDIQMPGVDGFAVINSVGADQMPVVVFVTAFERYALEAFTVNALDYLLKPWEPQRFQSMLQRARQTIHIKRQLRRDGMLEELLRQVRSGQEMLAQVLRRVDRDRDARYLERLVIRCNGRISFLRVDDIDWIKAAGDYLELHHHASVSLLRGKIGEIERRLDPRRFLRVHRSSIVNVERIKEMHPLFHGDCVIILNDKTEVPVSRTYRERIEHLLDRGL